MQVSAVDLLLFALAAVGLLAAALVFGLYMGVRAENAMLRSLVTTGSVSSAPAAVFSAPPEAEERAASAALPPGISDDMITRGAKEILQMAKEQGLELTFEQAREAAFQNLVTAYTDNL